MIGYVSQDDVCRSDSILRTRLSEVQDAPGRTPMLPLDESEVSASAKRGLHYCSLMYLPVYDH